MEILIKHQDLTEATSFTEKHDEFKFQVYAGEFKLQVFASSFKLKVFTGEVICIWIKYVCVF